MVISFIELLHWITCLVKFEVWLDVWWGLTCLEFGNIHFYFLAPSVRCSQMVWGCMCGCACVLHQHSTEWTDIWICQCTAYFKFIPSTHKHSHTIWGPWTDGAKSGHCPWIFSFRLCMVVVSVWGQLKYMNLKPLLFGLRLALPSFQARLDAHHFLAVDCDQNVKSVKLIQ